MRRLLLPLLALALPLDAALAQANDQFLALARKVLSTTPLIDGHNDLPWRIREDKSGLATDVVGYDLRRKAPGMTDFDRLAKGMLGGQFWSVYIPGEIKDSGFARVQLEQIDIARRVIERYPDKLQFCETALCLRQAFAEGRIGSMLGMEGGHAIENSLGALRAYYALGARYMTLTHNVTLDWADAALDKAAHQGLTPFGEEVVREMNRLGMLVDLSHVSPGVMSDALSVTEAPVIFSHSSSRAIVDHPRNVPDSILARLPKNGGVVMVTFVTSFISPRLRQHDQDRTARQTALRQQYRNDAARVNQELAAWDRANPAPKVTLGEVADHIEHIRKVAGVDHLGIGSDFDGIEDTIEGLEDVSTFPALFAELARRGWSENDLRKLAGENVLRVIETAEKVSARLRKERPASTKTIDQLDRKSVS
ncbi:MAG: dipeptidase [Gemmatimonadales bacterium]